MRDKKISVSNQPPCQVHHELSNHVINQKNYLSMNFKNEEQNYHNMVNEKAKWLMGIINKHIKEIMEKISCNRTTVFKNFVQHTVKFDTMWYQPQRNTQFLE